MKLIAPGAGTQLNRGLRPSTIFLAVLLLLTLNENLVAQQPSSTTTPNPALTQPKPASDKAAPLGIIKGRVVAFGARAPKNTVVSIRSLNSTSGGARMTRVDSEGRFAFDGLRAGVYNILATAPGFIDENLATADMSEWPRHFPGAQVTVRMVKGGVITGTIKDQKGDPVVGVNVRALQIGDQQSLMARFSGESHQVETDDRGIYRIYGLPAGEYLVAAGGRRPFGQFSPTNFDLDAPTYYPSSSRDTAVPVSVRSAEEAAGIDIRYRSAQGYSISGALEHTIDSSSRMNISSISLFDLKTNTMVSIASNNLNSSGHSFRFDGLADGEYELVATFFSRADTNWAAGIKRVTVSGADVTGVEIPIGTLSSIEGSIKLEPAAEKCDKRGSQIIELLLYAKVEPTARTDASRLRSMYSMNGAVTPNGTFKTRNLEPGRFRFVFHLPTDAWYLHDIQLPAPQSKTTAQASPPRKPVPWQGTGIIKSGEDLRDVVITIGQDAAGLSGSVALPKGVSSVPEGLQVHLVPVDREQANNVLRYYETTVESDARFKLSHIAPGRYFSVTRIRPPIQTKESQRPEAWDAVKRAELRRAAEISKNEIELKSCQKLNDHVLNVGAPVN
jgi:hypothetical protein